MCKFKILITSAFLLSLGVGTSEAALNGETSNGVSLVYDSAANITWTADANLLGTLESTQGYDTVVNAVIAANGGVVHDTPNPFDNGVYTLSSTDFNSGGLVSWWGAQAFVTYLNQIDYGGSHQWALPAIPDNDNSLGLNRSPSQFNGLFYNGLGGIAQNPIPVNSLFSNQQVDLGYWSGTENAAYPNEAWYFLTVNGYQSYYFKNFQFNAWAISPGNAAAVSLPGAAWLFGSALLGLLALKSRTGIGKFEATADRYRLRLSLQH